MVFQNDIIAGASGAAGGYEIENSVRLDGVGDMSRTVGSDGDLREWSWSFWVKRSGLGTNGGLGFNIGGTYTDASNRSIVRFYSSGNGTDDFYWAERSGGAWREDQWTIAQYRDTSAWYHILLVWDTDGGTTPRARRYINGVQITDLGSSPAAAANVDSGTNKAGTFQLFDQAGFPGREFEGYCAEMHFVDGSALEPTDFGEFNTDGVWIPKQVTGITYGSNGFYLDFADSSDLGKDVSGNGNDFTSSGLATTDQMLDTPTNNFCTWNPLRKGPAHTLSDGNLLITSSIADATFGTFMVSSGKWYWEITALSAEVMVGIGDPLAPPTAAFDTTAAVNTRAYSGNLAQKFSNGTSGGSYGATFTTNDIIGVALNLDDGEITFYKNNSSQGVAFTGLTGFWGPGASVGNTRSCRANFGQSAFTYTPPTDFLALNTANLPTPSITDGSKYFQPTLYSGNSSTQEVNQSGNSTFTPGWVWIKPRNGAGYSHQLFDQVRGATKRIFSDATSAEATTADTLTSFDSDGFSLGGQVAVNETGKNMVAWQWKANGAGSSNTDGDITSTVSANTTAGFSIATYTGNASSSQTIGHGLGQIPSLVMFKELDSSSYSWQVYHASLGYTQRLILNGTNAAISATNIFSAAPTSTVFTVGNSAGINTNSASHVMYSFAEIPGYSSIGSYTGNGSTDGPFVYTGFKPAFVMTKRTNAAGDWKMWDNERGPYNVNGLTLAANSFGTESSGVAQYNDFLSNGFKIRGNDTETNGSGSTYIYMAFAETPFKTTTAR